MLAQGEQPRRRRDIGHVWDGFQPRWPRVCAGFSWRRLFFRDNRQSDCFRADAMVLPEISAPPLKYPMF